MEAIPFDILVLCAGIFAGLLGSLIGLGGGIIITPVLVLGFGIDIKYAMGAALVSLIATSSGAMCNRARQDMMNIKIGILLSIATVIGAVIGAYLATIANPSFLSLLFGAVLILTVILSIFKKQKPTHYDKPSCPLAEKLELPGELIENGQRTPYKVYHVKPALGMMGGAGLLSGLLGIGAGPFKVIAMDTIMKLPFKVSTATSNFIIGITAAASVGVYLKSGFIDPLIAYPVAMGVLVGAILGGKLLPHIPVKVLKMIFFAVISIVGVQMMLKGLGV